MRPQVCQALSRNRDFPPAAARVFFKTGMYIFCGLISAFLFAASIARGQSPGRLTPSELEEIKSDLRSGSQSRGRTAAKKVGELGENATELIPDLIRCLTGNASGEAQSSLLSLGADIIRESDRHSKTPRAEREFRLLFTTRVVRRPTEKGVLQEVLQFQPADEDRGLRQLFISSEPTEADRESLRAFVRKCEESPSTWIPVIVEALSQKGRTAGEYRCAIPRLSIFKKEALAAATTLLTIAQDSTIETDPRRYAIGALSEIGVDSQRLGACLDQLIKDNRQNEFVRAAAAAAAKSDEVILKQVTNSLLNAIRDTMPDAPTGRRSMLRSEAVGSLTAANLDKSAIPLMEDVARNEIEGTRTRADALTIISRFGPEAKASVPVVASCLAELHFPEELTKDVVATLKAIGSKQDVLEALKKLSTKVREAAPAGRIQWVIEEFKK